MEIKVPISVVIIFSLIFLSLGFASGQNAITFQATGQGHSWEEIQCNQCIEAENVKDGSITTREIADNSVDGDLIADNSLFVDRIAYGEMTGEKIVDGSITPSKLFSPPFTSCRDIVLKDTAYCPNTPTLKNPTLFCSAGEVAVSGGCDIGSITKWRDDNGPVYFYGSFPIIQNGLWGWMCASNQYTMDCPSNPEAGYPSSIYVKCCRS